MEILKEISYKAYEQMEDKIQQISELSTLYDEQKEEIYKLYEQANHLKNHMIMLDKLGQYSAILTLSSAAITKAEKLLYLAGH